MCENGIRKARKEQGITMGKLAERSNITTSYLCHLEKGTRKNPSVKVMEQIAKSLKKSVGEIFFLE